MIEFACTCGKIIKLPEALAGKRVKCRTCGAILRVAAGPAEGAAVGNGEPALDKSNPPPGPRQPSAASPQPTSEALQSPEEEVVLAFDAFERKSMREGWLPCSLLFVLIAAAVALGVYVHWAVGLLVGLAVVIPMCAWINLQDRRDKRWAAEAVRDIEGRRGLSPDQSLELFWPRRPRALRTGMGKAFVVGAWGEDAYKRMQQRPAEPIQPQPASTAPSSPGAMDAAPPKALPRFACGYCHVEVPAPEPSPIMECAKCRRKLKVRLKVQCPKCGGSPELKADLVGGTGAAIVGGILLGGLGAAIGKAMGGKSISTYCCKKCAHRWGIELFEQADW